MSEQNNLYTLFNEFNQLFEKIEFYNLSREKKREFIDFLAFAIERNDECILGEPEEVKSSAENYYDWLEYKKKME